MVKEKAIAVLTIRDAGRMSDSGREEVAEWLRSCADCLIDFGEDYSATFRARYFSVPGMNEGN